MPLEASVTLTIQRRAASVDTGKSFIHSLLQQALPKLLPRAGACWLPGRAWGSPQVAAVLCDQSYTGVAAGVSSGLG